MVVGGVKTSCYTGSEQHEEKSMMTEFSLLSQDIYSVLKYDVCSVGLEPTNLVLLVEKARYTVLYEVI